MQERTPEDEALPEQNDGSVVPPIPGVRPASPTPPPPPLPRSGGRLLAEPAPARSGIRTGLAGLLGGIVGALAMFAALSFSGALEAELTVLQPVATVTTVAATSEPVVIRPSDGVARVTAVAAKTLPSIVTVLVSAEDRQVGDLPLGSGSGVVLSADGHVVTNHHVVEGASSIRLVLTSGRTYRAELVGSDPLTDLAVLRTDAPALVPVPQAAPDGLRIGDAAVAVGNPLGLEGPPSVTSGIVSAFNRTLEVEPGTSLYGLIQTDAPITRGSSGGALVDGRGRLIGITTAIGVTDVGAEGLGFAVPVAVVRQVTSELIEDGRVEHAYLGVQGQTEFRPEDDGAEVPAGARVAQLEEGSALAVAGGRVDDVIVTLEGSSVDSIDHLVGMLRAFRAGQTVSIEVLRDGEPMTLEVTLDRHPGGG